MPPKTMTAPRDLLVLTEKQWQRLVTDTADLFRWKWAHFPQMAGNPKGWPDLVLMKNGKTVYAELKTEKGQVSPAQRAWHDDCLLYGIIVYVWRPSDWPRVVKVLGEGHDVEGV